MTNTLAYYDSAIITAVKSFILLAPWHERLSRDKRFIRSTPYPETEKKVL
jgi:hypothetical protein